MRLSIRLPVKLTHASSLRWIMLWLNFLSGRLINSCMRNELSETQMKATGEVMAIGTSFEQAMMKAVRSTELALICLI